SIEDLNIKRKALEQKLRESESESTALARQIAELDGRKRGIEATLASNEGVSSGSRAVLDLMRQGILQGDVRLLVDGLDVPTMYTAAIDAALGHAVHDLIAMDRESALNAVTHLAEHRLGLATIHVPNVLTDNEEPGFRPTIPGTIGWASALIECEAILKSTIDVLLGDVLVVESLVDADKLLESPGCRAVVSLGGDYVITGSSIAGGKTGRSLGSAVQRKSDAKALEATIQDLVKQSEGLDAVNQETDAEIKACSASEAKLRSRLDELSTQLSDAKTWHNRIEIELRSMQSAKSKLQSELSTLEQTVLVHVEPVNLQLLEQERDTAWEAYMKASGATDTIRSSLEALRNDEATKKARATELKGRLASALSARESRNSRVQNLDSARRECRKSIGLLDEELKRLVPIESEHDSSLELLETERKRNMELAKDRQILSDTVRLSIAARESTVHKFELERARHEVQRASLIERLLDDYGLGETQALELARVQTLPKDAASEVAKHRREIRDIGDVNLGAIDAYERMSERHCELRGQLEDIESGAEDIRASIRELDSITTERFESTFELVKEAFSKTFRQLFEGGEGHVILVRGDADQDAGVDIVITLPGKRRQRLELLSGGERALAALAFLFALLAVKPSPLVVLDEVDAPLDGRNVERFVHLMREWSEKIQFILVTHNPMTIESADVWFGVTMQEPGVSTLIPYRLPDKSIVKATVPDRYLKG
ncbi:MAG: AAA family ATPase, partial [Chthonomonadaceae bacterium]|nr:AAA family ATPase [Chthonomonadaceae bacterium]